MFPGMPEFKVSDSESASSMVSSLTIGESSRSQQFAQKLVQSRKAQQQEHDNNTKVQVPIQKGPDLLTAMTPVPQIPNHRNTTRGKEGSSWWERVVVQRSSYVVDELVEQYTASSPFLRSQGPSAAALIAVLDRTEIETGALLGQGTYSNVYEVSEFRLLEELDGDKDWFLQGSNTTNNHVPNATSAAIQRAQRNALKHSVTVAPSSKGSEGGGNQQQTTAMEEGKEVALQAPPDQSSYQRPNYRYAVKHLKPELLKNSKLFEAAATDLIMEAKMLSRLDHPNILKLRGMAIGGTAAFCATGLYDACFLVVDKLEETLIQRIKRWKAEQMQMDQSQSIILGMTPNHNKYDDTDASKLLMQKVDMALQVARALDYLHARRLVFRDLKPHNIGLKQDGTIQLLDFGFARELPDPPPQIHAPNDPYRGVAQHDVLYHMSGKGTLLYMASEILGTRCYNQKADVYSWSMVVYEMMTLDKPFPVRSIEQHKRSVCERGERPVFPPFMASGLHVVPPALQNVLEHSWEANVMKRWSMAHCCHQLEDLLWDWARTPPLATLSPKSTTETTPTNNNSMFCNVESFIVDITNDVQTRYDCVSQQMWGCLGPTSPQKKAAEWEEAPTVVLDSQRSSKHLASKAPNGFSSSYRHMVPSLRSSSRAAPSLRMSSMDHAPRATVLPMSSLLEIKERLSTVKDEEEETEGESMGTAGNSKTIPEETSVEAADSSDQQKENGEEVSLIKFAETVSGSTNGDCSTTNGDVQDYTRSITAKQQRHDVGEQNDMNMSTSLDAVVRTRAGAAEGEDFPLGELSQVQASEVAAQVAFNTTISTNLEEPFTKADVSAKVGDAVNDAQPFDNSTGVDSTNETPARDKETDADDAVGVNTDSSDVSGEGRDGSTSPKIIGPIDAPAGGPGLEPRYPPPESPLKFGDADVETGNRPHHEVDDVEFPSVSVKIPESEEVGRSSHYTSRS